VNKGLVVMRTTRRETLTVGAGALSLLLVRPARATPDSMAAAIQSFVGGSAVQKGRVVLEVPALVENGNSVPLRVTVESPMKSEDYVKTIAVFNERNPQPGVANFHKSTRRAG